MHRAMTLGSSQAAPLGLPRGSQSCKYFTVFWSLEYGAAAEQAAKLHIVVGNQTSPHPSILSLILDIQHEFCP